MSAPEYEIEPVRGLPGVLPKGETLLWQGSPDWRILARSVFHTRLVTIWFVAVAGAAFLAGGKGLLGAVVTLAVAVLGLAVLGLLAYGQARTTVYTLTDKRVVMRFGMALPKCVNLPLSLIGQADLRPSSPGHADVALVITERFPLGWLQMWPHIRPWALGRPQPMLRAVPDSIVPLLAKALADADPSLQRVHVAQPADAAKGAAETVAPYLGVAA